MNLFPPQQDVIDMGFVEDKNHYFINMATGTGKTYLAEIAMDHVLQSGFKVIYITPLRALAQQQQERWKKKYNGFKVGAFTGDSLNKVSKNNNYNSSNILIMTPERFDACLRHWRTHWSWIPEVSLVIVDEFHIINQGYRGARLEGAMTRMIRLNPFVRFIALSATMPNSATLAKWLQGKNYESHWRQITIESSVERFSSAKDKPELALNHLKKCVNTGGQAIVFCNSRSRVQQLTEYLNKNGIKTTCHHAGLTSEVRQKNEKNYSSGIYQVMVATSTVEMGLNFPTRQVILYDSYSFTDTGFSPLPVWSYIQRMGRAGRPGLDKSGESILLLPKWSGDSQKYLNEECEPVCSQLTNEYALTEQILVDVFSGFSRTRDELKNGFIPLTLFYSEHPDSNINGIINKLVLKDLLIEKDSTDANDFSNRRLEVSLLGRMSVKLMFSPETVILIYKYKKAFPKVFLFDLLLIATMNKDCSPILHTSFEDLDIICDNVQHLPSVILDTKLDFLQKKIIETPQSSSFLNAVKMSAICYEITNGSSLNDIALKYDVYESDLRLLQESVVRLLTGMAAISSAVDKKELTENESEKERARLDSFTSLCSMLSTMIQYGIDSNLVALTQIDGVGGATARKLNEYGFSTIESLKSANPEDLSSIPGIGKKLSASIIKQSSELKNQYVVYSEENIENVNMVKDIKSSIDPYRLRRSLELSVKGKDGGRFCITGGREDHIVRIIQGKCSCDCMDFAKNHLDCKHILCVKRALKDEEICKMAKKIKENHSHSIRETLPTLWYSLESIERL